MGNYEGATKDMKLSDILPTGPYPSCVDGVFYATGPSFKDIGRLLKNPNMLEGFLCDESGKPLSFDISQDQRDLIIAEVRQQASDSKQAIKDLVSSIAPPPDMKVGRPAIETPPLLVPDEPSDEPPLLVLIEQHLRNSSVTADRALAVARWALFVGVFAAVFSALTLAAMLISTDLIPEIGRLLFGHPDPVLNPSENMPSQRPMPNGE